MEGLSKNLERAFRGDISVLLEPGVSNDRTADGGDTVYHLLASSRLKSKDLDSLLEDPNIYLIENDQSVTALHILALLGEKKVLNHPQCAIVKNKQGSTPLHWLAIASCNREFGSNFDNFVSCEEVLSHPEVANVRDNGGTTPLHLLSSYGCGEIVKTHPEFEKVRDGFGRTPKDVYKDYNN